MLHTWYLFFSFFFLTVPVPLKWTIAHLMIIADIFPPLQSVNETTDPLLNYALKFPV